jgi:hypothetical protein
MLTGTITNKPTSVGLEPFITAKERNKRLYEQ